MKNLRFAGLFVIIISSLGNVSGQVDTTSKLNSPPDSPDYFAPDLPQGSMVIDGKRLNSVHDNPT